MDGSADKKVKAGKTKFMTGGLERASYGLYFVGQNIFYILMLMFLTTYFTDVGIPALTVAGLTLVVKVWDAVNDPIFGGLVDKIKFKKGKFLPWLRISLIMIPISTILIFAIPSGIPTVVKVVWAAISYMLWDTAYTICDVPIFGLVTTMTDNQQERTVLMTIGRMAAMVAAIVVMMVVPLVRSSIGGWLPTAIVLSVAALILMLPICFAAKERVAPKSAEQETGIKEMFRFIVRNKYMLFFFGAITISGATNIGQTLGLLFARHCLGDEGLMSITSILAIVPTLVVGFFIPALTKRIDKYFLFFGATIATMVLGVVAYFVGYRDFTLYLVLMVIRGLPLGVTTMLMFMFTPDCAEYGLYKTGIAAPGISFSIQTFTAKLTAALASSVGALALSIIGFVELEGSLQPEGFPDRLWFVYTILPVIGCALSLILLSRYKLRDKDVQVMAKYNAGEIPREEADKLLGGRYE